MSELYEKYRLIVEKENPVIFGGLLGECRYYDIDKIIEAAVEKCRKE